MTKFAQKIISIVKTIPPGQVMTYREVAISAGRPKAYRAVGNILNKNYLASVPCHRVIRSDGTAGGYNRGAKLKQTLLAKENIHIKIRHCDPALDAGEAI